MLVVFLLVSGVGLVLASLIYFLVPVLMQARRVGDQAEALLAQLGQELPLLLRRTTQTLERLDETTRELPELAHHATQTLRRLNGSSDPSRVASDASLRAAEDIFTSHN